MGTFAQQTPNSGSIEVITTFDYPGAGNSTLPQKINDRGDIVGIYLGPKPEPGATFHPAGFILSIIGAIILLFVWGKLAT